MDYFIRGVAYSKNGEKSKAKDDVAQAKEINP
jgi:hypothetical protein